MKIKKFNENIEWLDGEVMPLRDLCGTMIDESAQEPHPFNTQMGWVTQSKHFEIVKQSFSRGTFAFKVFLKEHSTESSNNYITEADLDSDVKVELRKKEDKYQLADLYVLGRNVNKKLIGFFDLKGNLIFMMSESCVYNRFYFNGVFSFQYLIEENNPYNGRIERRARIRFRVDLDKKYVVFDLRHQN